MAWPFRTKAELPGGHEMVTRILVSDEENRPVYMTALKGGRAEVVIDGERFRIKVERMAVKSKPLAIEA